MADLIDEQSQVLEDVRKRNPAIYDVFTRADGIKDTLKKIKEREEAYSAFDRFSEKGLTTKGLTARISDLLAETTGVQTELEWWNAEEGYHFPSLTSLEDRLGRYGLEKEWKEAWDAGDQKKKAEVLDKLHYERTKEKYGDIAAKEAPDTVADVLGEVFGYAADPTTLLPISTLSKGASTAKTLLNIAGVGGITTGLETAVGEYAGKGEVNPAHIGIAAGIGAVAPNAVYLLGKGFGKIVERYSQKTGKSAYESATAIEKAIVEDTPVDVLGPEFFVKEPNPYRKRWSELVDEDFGKAYPEYLKPPDAPPKSFEEAEAFRRRLFANVEDDVVPELDPEITRQAYILGQSSPRTELLANKVEDAIGPKSGALDLEWRTHPYEEGNIKLLVPKDYTEEQFIQYVRSLDKSPPPPEWKRSYAPFTRPYEFSMPEDVPYSQRGVIPDQEIKPGHIDPDNNVVVVDKTSKTFHERRMTPKELELKEIAAKKKGTKPANLGRVREEKNTIYRQAKAREEAFLKEDFYKEPEVNFRGANSEQPYPDSAMQRAVDRLSTRDKKALNDILNKQSGVSQLDVMSHMASSAVGAAYGFYDNGWQGAAWGATLGLAAPTIIQHGWKGLKSVKDWSARDYTTAFALKSVRITGQSAIRGYGKAGRILAEKFDLYKEDVEMAVGDKLTSLMDSLYQNGFKKLTKKEKNVFLSTVRGVLDKTIADTDPRVSPQIMSVVTHQRKAFDDVIDEAIAKGVYSQVDGDALKANAAQNGYFPRMWDHAFLDTAEGKELFLDSFSSIWHDEEAAKRLLRALLHDDKYVSQYMTLTRRNGNEVQFTYEAAKKIFAHFDKMRRDVRSTHLEESRKIVGLDENFLKTFMLKDPMAILKEYYVDVYSRLKAFPHFHGLKPDGTIEEHRQAKLLFEDIEETYGGLQADYTKENYYLLMKDSERSQTFRAIVGQNPTQRKILQYLHAYTTISKLALAAIPNVVQAIVMGGIKTANAPVSTTKLLAKQAWNIFTEGKFATGERKHYADRLGAALDLSLMEVFSEGSGEVGRMTERFLKATGFFGAEHFNRVFATNLGREYAIELLDTYSKHINGTHRLSARRESKLIKAMDEMSLPRNRPVMVDDVNRAAVRFNNTVNFVASPYKMPIALQTPYGRIIGKFKTFTIQTSMFVRDNIIKPATLFTATGGRRGTVKPLITALTFATVIGMPLDSLRRWVKEDDKEYSNTEQFLRGVMMLGGLGFVQDFVGSFGSNTPGRVYETVLGPIVSDVVKLAGSAYEVGKDVVDTLDKADAPTNAIQVGVEGLANAVQKQWVIPAPVSIRDTAEEIYRWFVDKPTYTPRQKKISPEMENHIKGYKLGYATGGLVTEHTVPVGDGAPPMFSLRKEMLMQILGMGEFDDSGRTPTATF